MAEHEDFSLRITKANLRLIVSGEKKHEFRDSIEFYFRRFATLKDGFWTLKKVDRLKLYVGNEQNCEYAIVKVSRLRHVVFEDKLIEEFKRGDTALCFDIEGVIETNVVL